MMPKGAGNLFDRVLPLSRASLAMWAATALTSVALLALPEAVGLDGKRHEDWMQFLGRFHPLAVHIPIGLIVLVPLLEAAGRFRPALREAAGFVLTLACAACLGSLLLGFLLTYGSGEKGITVTRHMWGGIALAIGLMLCVIARSSLPSSGIGIAYPLLLTWVLIALIWTAHQGGTLTHGSNYLTEYMPSALRRIEWFGRSARAAESNSFYDKRIHAILDANCVTCHGTSKQDGGLRLDTYQLIMRGGKDGRVVVPGDAQQSVLLERITLAPDNKNFMPAEGRPPLKTEEIAEIRAWIVQGASPSVLNLTGFEGKEASREPPIQPVGDYSALMLEIQEMARSQGAKLLPVSAIPSDGLILSTVDSASSFGDLQLKEFQKFAPFVVEANLARTGVTDASLETLSKFSNLQAIHLEGTAVTGRGLSRLSSLTHLTYLNLSETKVDSVSVAMLASMKSLRHVYLFNTPAEPEPDEAGQAKTRSTK